MTAPTSSKSYERIEDLEEEIEELHRQKYLIQSQYDFADFIETHNLVEQEIERLRLQLKEEQASVGIRDDTDDEEH